MEKIINIIRLLRCEQWLKNLFVFLPLFFDAKLFDVYCLINSTISFFAMNFACSAIYCFNDIIDIEQDKLHIQKSKRPLASGKITIRQAYFCILVCVVIALGISLFIEENHRLYLVGILLFYWIMNFMYSLKLKQIAIVDVFIIAIGFVLRVVLGGLVCNIYISHWIILMTFLLALFLAFAKRRDDVAMTKQATTVLRKSITGYNLAFLNQTLGIIAAITMVCYIMYTVSEEVCKQFDTKYLYITSLWVLAGIIHYLKLTIVNQNSGSPTKILIKDKFIQICIVCWIINFAIIIYL